MLHEISIEINPEINVPTSVTNVTKTVSLKKLRTIGTASIFQ